MVSFFEKIPGIILFFLGSLAVWCFIYQVIRFIFINWIKTEGVIESSRIDEKFNRMSESTVHSRTYAPLVAYKYYVNGRSMMGNKLYSGLDFYSSSKSYAQLVIKKYHMGKSVDVYYNSKKPEDTCLERKIHAFSWIFLVIGSVFYTLSYFELVIW